MPAQISGRRRPRHRALPGVVLCLAALTALGLGIRPAAAAPAPAQPPATGKAGAGSTNDGKLSGRQERAAIAKLPAKYREWLLEVEVLITKVEKDAFLALDQDYQRDAFIKRFWEVRDKASGERGEFHRRWQARIEEARSRWKTLADERARIYLLNGPPAGEIETRCATLLWPVDIWYYATSDTMGSEFIIIFYQHWGAGPFRIWDPLEGLGALLADSNIEERSLNAIANGCRDGDKIAGAISWVSNQGMQYAMLQARFQTRPKPPGTEWVSSFRSYSTDLPPGAALLPASLEIGFPGRTGARTVVQGVITLPSAAAGIVRLADRQSYNFLVTGEVLENGELFENFRYKFEFPAQQPEKTLPLVFQRPLRPGQYNLIIKLEDLNSSKLFRAERPVAVPALDQEMPPPPSTDPTVAAILREADDAARSGEATVKIVAPRGELQTGMLRFDTVTTGPGIDRVTFSLDKKPVLTKRKPPYSVELDLGSLPRPHHLTATAYDAAGKEVAADDLVVNAAGQRFRLRLLEPQRGKRYAKSLLARSEVDVPDGEVLDRVEFYLDETLVATLYQPPFTQPIVLSGQKNLSYVRSVAYTSDGSSTEDLVFVNAPDNVEQLNVQFVELYATTLDRRMRPVNGLAKQDFSVLEDGKPQEIARFEQVADQPIHAALVLDTSASMEKALDTSREAALRFLQEAIKPKDRASIITFNDHPNIAVKFSNDMTSLAGGLAGLKAERGTALYDTVIFSMYYFTGVKGQRAILLFTDGRDEGSRFSFDDALEYTRRAGVILYAIGLGDEVEKRKLTRLSEETGGRAFFIKSAAELGGIYKQIEEELRSQYLIAYQSKNTGSETSFRTVEVKVRQPGLEVKTLHGYYP